MVGGIWWMFPKGVWVLFPAGRVGGMGLGPSARRCHPFPCRAGLPVADSGLAPAAESLFCLPSLKMETCFSFYPPLKKKTKTTPTISKKATVPAKLVVSKGVLQGS